MLIPRRDLQCVPRDVTSDYVLAASSVFEHHFCPRIGLEPCFLFLFGQLVELAVVDPPGLPALVFCKGLSPDLIPVATKTV